MLQVSVLILYRPTLRKFLPIKQSENSCGCCLLNLFSSSFVDQNIFFSHSVPSSSTKATNNNFSCFARPLKKSVFQHAKGLRERGKVKEKQRIKDPVFKSSLRRVFSEQPSTAKFLLKCFKEINFYLCEAHWLCHQDYASKPIPLRSLLLIFFHTSN